MYYEVCLDVLFVLNMVMDFFLLRLVGLVLQNRSAGGEVCWAQVWERGASVY